MESYSEFHLECLRVISNRMTGVKELVAAIGDDALAMYCERGFLSEEHIQRIKDVV